MLIHSDSGAIAWSASPDQIGVHRVVVEARDSFGATATQSYQIAAIAPEDNSDPIISSPSSLTIGAGQELVHSVRAVDDDRQTLRFRLQSGPEGAQIDPISGLLRWDATNSGSLRLNPYASMAGSKSALILRCVPPMLPSKAGINSIALPQPVRLKC